MHIDRMIQTDPKAGWVIVADNLNTHCGEAMVRTVARRLGINDATLGVKGKRGVLKSMAIGREFLSDRSHRIRFVYASKNDRRPKTWREKRQSMKLAEKLALLTSSL